MKKGDIVRLVKPCNCNFFGFGGACRDMLGQVFEVKKSISLEEAKKRNIGCLYEQDKPLWLALELPRSGECVFYEDQFEPRWVADAINIITQYKERWKSED